MVTREGGADLATVLNSSGTSQRFWISQWCNAFAIGPDRRRRTSQRCCGSLSSPPRDTFYIVPKNFNAARRLGPGGWPTALGACAERSPRHKAQGGAGAALLVAYTSVRCRVLAATGLTERIAAKRVPDGGIMSQGT